MTEEVKQKPRRRKAPEAPKETKRITPANREPARPSFGKGHTIVV